MKTTLPVLVLLFAIGFVRPAFAEEQDPNKKILKEAIVGAVTGAVAYRTQSGGEALAVF